MNSPLAVELAAIAAHLLPALVEAVVVTDALGQVRMINPAAGKLFVVPAEEVLGHSLRALHPGLQYWWERANAETPPHAVVFELELGKERFFSTRLTPVADGPNPLAQWLIVLQEVTAFKNAEHWRGEALQTAAHDLRNPLNLMVGTVNLLQDSISAPTSEQAECLAMLHASMERMSALIEQLLNLENMEAGEDLTLARLDLRQLMETTVNEFRYAASDKEPRLRFEGHPATAPILGDELWLNRAVANLVSNALKYTTGAGRIVVRYRETEGMAVCEVADTGPGIPAAAQARLFERFYRVRNSSTRSTPGTGLGLAIVKAIIEKHSGRVWVSSQEGQGSTFGFLVPLLK